MVQPGGAVNSRSPGTSNSQAPRTHARRCCLSCRAKKVRCHLQDPLVPNASDPLPAHLACSRCQRVGLACFVDDQHLKRLLIKPRPTTTPGRSLDTAPESGSVAADTSTSSDRTRREAAAALSSFAGSFDAAEEASPEQEGTRHLQKRRCLSALEHLPGETSLPDAAPLHLGTSPSFGEDAASLRRADDAPQTQSSGSTDTIRYLHRPLYALGELLSQDVRFRQYIEDNYKGFSEPASTSDSSIHDYVTFQLCEELEPLLQPLLAFSPYIPSLQSVYVSSKARASLPTDLLLAVLCSLALQYSPDKSHMKRRMHGHIDRLGTTILVSLPPAGETVMALTLLLAYEPMALCSGLLRFGPLKGSAIIGEALLTAAVSAALSLGFDKAEVTNASAPSVPQGPHVRASELDLCDTEAKISLWWTLSAWQAYFALNRVPFRSHPLDREAKRASSYIQATEDTSDLEVKVPRQQGRIYLAHRILMLAEIYAAIEQLEIMCSRWLVVPATGDVDARPTLPPVVQQIRREAEALCQRTYERLTEVEDARSVVAVQYGHSAEVTFLEGWLSLEQSSLHSLFLSKAAVAGVSGTMDFILPLPTFIDAIRTSESTSVWLERPGRARREAAERAIGAFCGLADGDTARAHSCNGRSRLAISDPRSMQSSEDGRLPTDQLWAFAPILTAALLLDSCRALLEAEAFTRLVSRRQSSRRECLTVLVKQAAARLKQSCVTKPSQESDASGAVSAQQSPINNCVAGMLEEMLVTLSQWHRHRSLQLARALPRNGTSLQVPRADTNGGASSSAQNMPIPEFPSTFREQASAALPDLSLAPAAAGIDDHSLSFLNGRQSILDSGLQWPPLDYPTDALWLDFLLSIESACT